MLPSDTIYGLSCQALDKSAVERIYSLKGRDPNKPFIILISRIDMLDLLSISRKQVGLTKKYWPGQVSFILEAPDSPVWLQHSTGKLAVRMPVNKALRDLIDKVGPIISTSANLEGQPPVESVSQAKALFGNLLDFYVDVGKIKAQPSTVVKLENGKLEVVRQGAVKLR